MRVAAGAEAFGHLSSLKAELDYLTHMEDPPLQNAHEASSSNPIPRANKAGAPRADDSDRDQSDDELMLGALRCALCPLVTALL